MNPSTLNKTLTTAAIIGLTAFTSAAHAKDDLSLTVYNAPQTSFGVNSTLISGEKEAILLDTGFTRSDAYRIAANVLDSGKQLKAIVISQADPDYYFGAEVLHEMFPDTPIVSTPAVIETMEKRLPQKLAFWGPKMGDNAPKNPIVPTVMNGNTLTLEGKTIEVRGTTGALADRPYVWIPSIKAIAGDVNTYADMHVWTADSATPADRTAWIKRLDEMQALQPKTLVPGHQAGAYDQSPRAIAQTRAYLVTFEKNLKKSKNSAQLIEAMKQAYPQLPGVENLEMGAKVATGEMKW